MSNAAVNNYRKYRTLSIILSMLAAFGMGKPSYADYECENRADNKSRVAAFFETHTTALRDQLELTAVQEPAWQTFITKMIAGEPALRTAAPEPANATTADHFDHKLAIMRVQLNHMEIRAHAVDELYGLLTAEQQHIFDEFFRSLRDQRKQT